MNANVQLVQDFYSAVGEGDIPRAISLMAEDVEVVVPGPAEIPFAGSFHGHEGAGRFFGAVGQSARIDAFEPREFIADGNQVVVVGHEELTVLATDRSWSTDWVMVWTITDGQVRRLREFHQTEAIAAAYR